MIEDAGRGYRQVVPSPKPVDVVEKDMVNTLVDAGYVVITVGGGGIPVIRKDGRLVGTPAVIDKDFASAKLAELVKADKMCIRDRWWPSASGAWTCRSRFPTSRRSARWPLWSSWGFWAWHTA